MMNLPEIDTWGHWYGPADTKVFRSLMRNIDRGIGELEATYQKAGILDQTDFIITADHGMMESRPAHDAPQIQSLAKSVGAQIVRDDGEGGAIWLHNPGQAKAVADRLVAARIPHVEAIFYRSNPGLDYHYVMDSPAGWLANQHVADALQYLVGTTAGRDGPDVWTLYRENFTIVPRNVAGTWKGTHGGATWKVQHVPLIMAGPGMRQGVHSQFPARAIDIAPTLERLLGLPRIPRDGVILADALTQPTRAEAKPQQDIASSLKTYVQALQLQSKLDSTYHTRWPTLPPPATGCTIAPAPAVPPHRSCSITPYTATNQ
jgi:arylsulfatase A-like enzyme